MTDNNKATTRHQLSNIAGVVTSHARVRTYLSDHFINRESAEKVFELKEKIEEIKKVGAPARPDDKPANISKKATDAEKAAYANARKGYDEQLSKYNKYVSDEYVELKAAHVLVKHFMKMEELLLAKKANEDKKKELNKSGFGELTKLQSGFNTIVKYKNEKDEVYAKRSTMHTKVMKVIGGVNVTDVTSVQNSLGKLKTTYPNLGILLEKDEWSRKALRINEQATIALATIIDQIFTQLARHTMDDTLKTKSIIQPDNCVSDGIEECSLFPLVNILPHYVAIEDRQQRREDWSSDKKSTDDEAAKKARAVAKRKNEKYTRPVSKVTSFENCEVKDGYAVKIDQDKLNKEGKPVTKTKYLWYGIDIERDDDENGEADEEEEGDDETDVEEERSNDFKHYAKRICLNIRKELVDEGYVDYEKIRLSKPSLKFFSNIAIDFIARISPLITELITFKGSSTITDEVVKVALRMMLLDSRSDVDGTNELPEEHMELMNMIDSKVRMVSEYQTKSKTASQAASQEGVAEDNLDEEELEEEIEEPAPPARRRRPARK